MPSRKTSSKKRPQPKTIGLLAIHGFSGHPDELAFLARGVADDLTATLAVPLLPGHGTQPADLARTSASDWYEAVRTAYDALADSHAQVVVLGNSFGANLALKLAAERPVRAVVGISIPRTRWYQAFLLQLLLTINRPFRSFWQKPTTGRYATEVIPGYTQRAYEQIPLSAMHELLRFEARDMRPRDLHGVTAATLFVVPVGDPFVPAEAASYYHAQLSSPVKQILPWNDHFHLVVQGERKSELRRVISFWLKDQLRVSDRSQ